MISQRDLDLINDETAFNPVTHQGSEKSSVWRTVGEFFALALIIALAVFS